MMKVFSRCLFFCLALAVLSGADASMAQALQNKTLSAPTPAPTAPLEWDRFLPLAAKSHGLTPQTVWPLDLTPPHPGAVPTSANRVEIAANKTGLTPQRLWRIDISVPALPPLQVAAKPAAPAKPTQERTEKDKKREDAKAPTPAHTPEKTPEKQEPQVALATPPTPKPTPKPGQEKTPPVSIVPKTDAKAAPLTTPEGIKAQELFKLFAVEWLKTVAKNTLGTESKTEVKRDGDKWIASYTVLDNESLQLTVKTSEYTHTPFIGIMKYSEVLYQAEGKTEKEAKAGSFSQVKKVNITEIFRYSKNKWIY